MVIDLSVETKKAETAKNTYFPPTSEEKLLSLIGVWRYNHLETKLKWKAEEVEILEAGWLIGAGEAWAYAKVRLGEQQPSYSYIDRSLYDEEFSRRQDKIESTVAVILKIAQGEMAVLEYSTHYQCEIEFGEGGGGISYFERGKEVNPSSSMQAYAERISSVATKLKQALSSIPSGNLSDMGGKEIVARTLWEAESALQWTKTR